jgi:hypothetical protein
MSNGLELRKGMYKEASLPRHSGKARKTMKQKTTLEVPKVERVLIT